MLGFTSARIQHTIKYSGNQQLRKITVFQTCCWKISPVHTENKSSFFTCAPSDVCIFHDLHCFLHFITGPNHVSLFKVEGELSELNSKLLLYYTPQVAHWNFHIALQCCHWANYKQYRLFLFMHVCVCFLQAFKNQICLDLAPSHHYDGRLTGHRVVNWDIKVRYEAFSNVLYSFWNCISHLWQVRSVITTHVICLRTLTYTVLIMHWALHNAIFVMV